jgi:VIT1/CCC1 family predicted Fe2+/Mn2+ transporter
VAFTLGGLVPFLAIVLSPEAYRIGATVIAVLIALILTGYLSATAGNASRKRAVIRVVIGGLLAMIITYYVGVIFGSTIR